VIQIHNTFTIVHPHDNNAIQFTVQDADNVDKIARQVVNVNNHTQQFKLTKTNKE